MPQFTNAAYDVLKPIALIWLPAIATLYTALAAIWGVPDVTAVVGSLSAIDGFLGVVLHLSTNPTPNQPPAAVTPTTSGQLVIDKSGPTAAMYIVLESEIEELEKNNTITLSVTPKT